MDCTDCRATQTSTSLSGLHMKSRRARNGVTLGRRRAVEAAAIFEAQQRLGLEEIRQGDRHGADAVAFGFAQPSHELVVGRLVLVLLDLQHGLDDLGADLLLLAEAEQPVRRDPCAFGHRHQGIGAGQAQVVAGQELRQGRPVDAGERANTETFSPDRAITALEPLRNIAAASDSRFPALTIEKRLFVTYRANHTIVVDRMLQHHPCRRSPGERPSMR